VALKFIAPAVLSPALRAMVVDREERFALLAAHDGVVRTHGVLIITDSGMSALDGALVLVMEWASTTCAELIASVAGTAGGRPVSGATRLLTEVALGPAHLHDGGVVHGDLKPANVLLVDGRPPLILDVARRRRAGLQPLLKPTHLVVTQLRPGTAGSLWLQCFRTAGFPSTTPCVGRLRRHLKLGRELDSGHASSEEVGRLLAHLLSSPSTGPGQTAAVGVSHPTSISLTVQKGLWRHVLQCL
jgi:serine/threonine protein kinase